RRAAARVVRGPERGRMSVPSNEAVAFSGAIAFSPDGLTLASANLTGTVRLWDLRAPEVAPRILRAHESRWEAAVMDISGEVAFSPDGLTPASVSHDRTIRLWALRAPEGDPAQHTGHTGCG